VAEPSEEASRLLLRRDLFGDGDLAETMHGASDRARIVPGQACGGDVGAPGEPLERILREIEEVGLGTDRRLTVVVDPLAERRAGPFLEPVEVGCLLVDRGGQGERMEAKARPGKLPERRNQGGLVFDRRAARRGCGEDLVVGEKKTDGGQAE
jgi:hypothetical protein